MRREAPDGPQRDGRTRVDRAVEAIAGLTAVDGATLHHRPPTSFSPSAPRSPRRGQGTVEQLTVTEPVEGMCRASCIPRLGGTRHLSAAQFVHDQRDAVALVASQDGRFTVFAWSTCEDMVHAHRVEALLL